MPIYRTYFTFTPVPSTPSWARKLTVEKLHAWQVPVVLDTVELIVSELVTNAVKAVGDLSVITAGGAPLIRYTAFARKACIRLRVGFDGEAVEISVWDSSSETPVKKNAAATDTGGRGLAMVEALSSRCGWYWTGPRGEANPGIPGKVVWSRLNAKTCAVASPKLM